MICNAAIETLQKENIVIGLDEALVWFEWKPEVPGADFVNTIRRVIRFCNEVNARVGRRVLVINNEWAHLLISGTTVEDGTRLTNEAGLFTGFFHCNSADLAIVEIDDETGMVCRGAPSDDRDWYVGAGGQARWDDQQAAVKLLTATELPLIAEHDIDPSGDDPVEYYRISRDNLEKMFAAA